MRQGSWSLEIVPALLATLAACGDVGTGAVRTFGSRQLLETRDSTIRLIGQLGDGSLIYSTGGDPVPRTGSAQSLGAGPPYAPGSGVLYWSLNLDDGHVESLGTVLPGFLSSRYSCNTANTGMGILNVTITDKESGLITVIERVSADSTGAICPQDTESNLAFLRTDDSGNKTLWTGRYDQLQAVPVDLALDGIVHAAFDADFRITTVTVTAALPAAPERLGLVEIDLTTFSQTQQVVPVLAEAAWATGAMPPAGQEMLESTSVLHATPQVISVRRVGDHYSYARRMSDGSATVFVGPLSTGPARELALFATTDSVVSEVGIRDPALTRGFIYQHSTLSAWHEWGMASTSRQRLHFWDDTRRRIVTCALERASTLVGQAAPDAGRALFFTAQTPENAAVAGPLSLVSSLGEGSCTTLTERVLYAGFSPDGASLFWLAAPPTGDPELWTAAGDGSAPRLLGVGAIDLPRFTSDTRISFKLAEDLVWLDLRDDPIRLHHVAERVFESGQFHIPGPWQVIGYDRSVTDATGTLGLVNWDTGAKRPISPSVSQYRTLSHGAAGAAGLPLRVIYLVRQRNPSREDGFWLAEIPAEDLQQ